MKITNIELTNDASPLTFDIIIIQNLWGFIDLKYPGNSSNVFLTFKYIYEKLTWRYEAWSRSLKIMQSDYIK